METEQKQSPFGIGVLAFMIAIGVSIGFYQFVYLPVINERPNVPEEILNPGSVMEVMIIEGSANPDQEESYIPKTIEVQLGVDNRVVWINEDFVAHTVTSDTGAEDRWSGPFDTLETIGLIQPGEEWEFLFTEEGEFPYHCEPHPWMTGMVEVIRQKF